MNKDGCKTILVVEDEAIISIVITKTLKRFGYDVLSANSGEKALDIVNSGKDIDLILMDIELGSGIDGTVAAQRILNIRTIPIVFHTSHSEREMVERVRGITRYGYVIKSSGDFVLQSSIEMAFELVEAHKKIKKSEEHFYTLFDKAPLGYQSLDGDGYFIEINQKWLDTLGYSRDEVIGKWFGDFLAPEFVDVFRERYPVFKAAGRIHSEFQMINKNGERRYISFDGRIGYTDDGSFQQTHCILSDITDRKIAEEALAVSEKRLIEAQKMARIGNWEYNIGTGKIWASDMALSLYGLIPADGNEIDIAKIESLIKDSERSHNELLELINNDKPYDIEIEVDPADGAPSRILHSIANCVKDYKGNTLRVVGVIQDITEQKQSQNALIESEAFIKSVMDNLPIGIAVNSVDPTVKFSYVNDNFIRNYRVTKDVLSSPDAFWDMVYRDPAYRESIKKRVIEDCASGKPERMYWKDIPITREGEPASYVTAMNVPLDYNKLMISLVWDVTEHKLALDEIETKNTELNALNEELNAAIEELEATNEEMIATMEELEAANEELNATNERLIESEQETERSEEKFRQMFFQHHAIMLLIDPYSGRIIDANSSAEIFYGYDMEKFRNMKIQEINLLGPEEIDAEMRQAREDKRNYFVFPHRIANSEIRTVEVYSSPVTINGNVLLFSIIHDITDRKLAEEKLRESEVRYSMALAAVDDGIWDWSVSDGKAFFNPQYYNMLKYEDGEFTASYNSWRELVYPMDIDRVEEILKASVESGTRFNIDLRMKTKPGDWLWVCIRGKVIESDKEGRATRMVGTLSDVTSRKHAELELINSQNKLKEIIENSSELICELDDQGRYTFVSGRYLDILGYTPDELVGTLASDKIHPDDLAAAEKKYDKIKSETATSIDEWRFMHKNGNYRNFECRGSVYSDNNGLIKTVVISHDITETKQLEDAQLFLIVSGSPLAGRDFFQSLARYLAESLDVDFVCIDKLVGDGLNARTVAVYFDGKFEDNIEYALKDTPCGEVVGKSVCTFNQDVRSLFPGDAVLQEMDAESYAGVTLWSSTGEPIGLIAVIGRKKMENPHVAETVLKMVAIRAAAELERRESEEKINNLLKEKEILLKEVHHRIKNNMNTVNGLLSLQAETVKDPAAVYALMDARNRVQSMMVLYDKLYRSDSFKEIPARDYLPGLIEEIISNFPNSKIVKTDIEIMDFNLNAKTLLPLGIIINEIISNMMKHAFHGRNSGMISVTASVERNHVKFVIRDNGIGIPESVTLEKSSGFGMQLVSMLTAQIGGTIKIVRETGACFILEFDM